MHGRREGEESKSLPCQHMCPVGIDSDKSTTDKVFPSPAGSSIPSDRSRSVPPSSDYFLKDGREIRSGDCALFQAGNVPPFIGLVRWFKPGEKEQFPKLRVSSLYRPSDIKLSKPPIHAGASPPPHTKIY